MKILVIGGTRFVGRHIVSEALTRDHEVTIFHRGKTNPGLFDDAEEILGDRMSDLHRLDGRWDVVIDTCGYFPRAVRLSAEQLSDKVDAYVFISTISVYRELSKEGIDESGYLKTLEDPKVEEVNPSNYGPLKTECEGVIKGKFSGRCLVVRPGVLAGPWDPTDRFSYWAWRVAAGGEVLAPQPRQAAVQLLDARDLARWLMGSIERNLRGTFNATGPSISFEAMLDACKEGTDSDAWYNWVSRKFLEKTELDTEQKMPLWNRDGQGRKAGLFAVNSDKARAEGLVCRPLQETARDICRWCEEHLEDHDWQVGLDLLEERELLERWHQWE